MIEMILSSPTRWYVIALTVFILDQSSKWLIGLNFSYGDVYPVMPFFNLTLVYNEGAAFSILSNAGGWQRWFLSGLAGLVSLGLIYWIHTLKPSQKLLPCALALVLGGALGNLMDRLLFGHVIDFIDWYYGSYHWPAFNLADSAICIGAVLLIIDAFRNPSTNAEELQPK